MEEANIDFYGELKSKSKYSYMVFDGVETISLPKSRVLEMNKISGKDYRFLIPEKLAKEKGII